MPVYEYLCEENGQVVTVKHSMQVVIRNWGELCFAAQVPLGDTDFETPVRKKLGVQGIAIPVGNSTLKRDKGIYENVTATGSEKRYMKAGDPSSMPHLHKKIGD